MSKGEMVTENFVSSKASPVARKLKVNANLSSTDKESLITVFFVVEFLIIQHERPYDEWTDVDFSAPFQECSPARLSFVQSLFQNAKQSSEDNHCHAINWLSITPHGYCRISALKASAYV